MEETQLSITPELLFHKICEVQSLLENPKVEKGLWDIHDVADYCGLSYNHTYSNIVSDPRFPAPVDIQGKDGGKAKRLFIREEVIAFFTKHKKKKNRV